MFSDYARDHMIQIIEAKTFNLLYLEKLFFFPASYFVIYLMLF